MKGMNAAVVGAGFIGPVHVEALRRLGVGVVGMLGCNREESDRARAALGLEKSYASLSELLDDPSVGSVHLAVPNALHYEFAKRALLAGKHVMCEKPLAMNTTQTARLVELSQSSGRAAAVCYNLRYYPLNLHARQLVRSGQVGEVLAINGSYAQDWLLHDTDYNWRVLADEGGALRAVADIGTHWMDLVLWITGLQIDAVFADLRTVHPVRMRPTGETETFTSGGAAPRSSQPVPITTDDYGCILFRFSNGARGSMHVSQVTAGRKNRLSYEIAGSNEALAFNSEAPNELWIGHRDRPNQLLIRDPALLAAEARPFANYPGGHNEGFPDAFKQCFRAFYDYIAAGNMQAPPGFPTFEDGHREVALCEAILASHQTERWVAPATDRPRLRRAAIP